jgi:predicted transcriptional regulator
MQKVELAKLSKSTKDIPDIESLLREINLITDLEMRTAYIKDQLTQLNSLIKDNLEEPINDKINKLNSRSKFLELSLLKNFLAIKLCDID